VTINTGKPEANNSKIDNFQLTPKLFQAWAGNFQKGTLGLDIDVVLSGKEMWVIDLLGRICSGFSEGGISGLSLINIVFFKS
jgi:hypothetical protein